jgi:LysR family hydrogen peroxide-inducible transcriptional activator
MITPLGRRLTEMARELILGAEDMIELARSTTAPLTGPMRLGVIPTIGPYLLPDRNAGAPRAPRDIVTASL